MEENDLTKRRMMFIKSEDYNFLTYNIFIILNGLNCVQGKSSLRDHRKISFLIDFISNGKLIDIIERQLKNPKSKINEVDRELLSQSFTDSLLRIRTINQLIFTLANEGFIVVTDRKLDKLNICLDRKLIGKEFLKGEIFKIERSNINRLKALVQRISILDISTMLSSLYYNNGIPDEQFIS
ncbi:hypothetical protein [Flavobacterium suzhouense]|uniref:Uncharacterized protein n=1 Tax=Flavobacterium suzhouense TaxID=1529638 RepID=A0ABW5NUJ5_9FLAO